MKKLFLALVLTLFVLSGVFSLPSDFRLKAMGNANATGNGDCGVVFNNPASLYFHNSTDFLTVHTSLYDDHQSGEGRNFPFLPGGDFHARFAGKFLSFTGSVMTESFFLREDGGRKYYSSLRMFSADVSATAGWNEIIAAGIGLNAGLSSERDGFAVNDKSRLTDFLLNMVAGEYDRLDDSEFATVRAGAQILLGGFRIGVLAPNVYTYTAENNGVFSADGLSFGLSYEGSKYYGRARLNKLVVSALAEIHDMAGEYRTVHLGAELTLNITPSNNVSLRAGYQSYAKYFKDGTLTLGACAVMGKFEINGYVELQVRRPGTIQYALDFVLYY